MTEALAPAEAPASAPAVAHTAHRPPFDPAIGRALAEFAPDIVTEMLPDQIEWVRTIARPFTEAELTLHGAFTASRHLVERPDGSALEVGVYLPVEAVRPMPVLLHLHGGGLVAGNADGDTPAMIQLAEQAGCALVVVEYRLAPEHPYPAALDDATLALGWLASKDSPALLDGSRIVVSGVSAGGGLAAATVLYARDHDGPPIIGQLLICPMLDHRNDSASGHQMAGAGSWDRTANATGWAAYLGDLAADDVPPYASPARAASLEGLPATFIDVGSAETFRDECVAYAGAIWRDGGDAELHVWPGGAHGFDFLAPWAPIARSARQVRVDWLRRVLARH